MLRAVSITVLLAAAAAAAAPLAAGQSPTASVKLVKCSFAEQEAVFRGRMRQVEDSERMWMRFALLERTGTTGYQVVRAPGLGVWRKSRPGVQELRYRQAVQGLPANAIHRMRVDFRWYDSDGALLQELRRHSAPCRQFETLPNLGVRILGAGPTQTRGVLRYTVRVANLGKADVADVPVSLSVDGDLVDTVTLGSLAAGERREIGFRGPSCLATVKAEVDAADGIVESSEDDNEQELLCAEIDTP
jgi:CARDB